MGFVPKWQLLTLCRVLLEIGELTMLTILRPSGINSPVSLQAGPLPAIIFIVSTWYVSHILYVGRL
jgi:hypothetical protein